MPSQFTLWAVALLAALLVGCSTIQPDFEKAVQDDTIPAYEAYITKYEPDPQAAPFVAKSRTRLRGLRFEQVEAKDTVPAYQGFISAYKETPEATEQIALSENRIRELHF
ncbi:MAG TPA: hypothetical protein EYM25_01800, partial [Deltaproteobacteria bacterium]|nr:hypothetical protein [Deltaproteobacteria bacterium]